MELRGTKAPRGASHSHIDDGGQPARQDVPEMHNFLPLALPQHAPLSIAHWLGNVLVLSQTCFLAIQTHRERLH